MVLYIYLKVVGDDEIGELVIQMMMREYEAD